MKRILTIAFFTLIGILETKAQVTLKPGIRTGVNFSRLTNFDSDFKTGFYLGGQLSIRFNKIYTLQPELLYSKQGANRSFSFARLENYDPYDPAFYSNSEVNYSIDYLSLSAINKFYFGGGFHLVVGPSLDFKINDNFKNSYYSSEPIGLDFAIVSGIGYSFSNGLSFDARFKQGIVDIFGNYDINEDSNNNGNYDEVVLNQSFQLGISYIFDVK